MELKKLKIGVVGVGRGRVMLNYCKAAENAELVAICDCWEAGLRRTEREYGDQGISYYTDFNEFLKHDMDVVMLANYATEHAPFAIACMEAGKNVISEVLPAQCMAQAVQLIEAVERTGMKYCYAENYCYMAGPREMRRRIQNGELGTPEYAEGEYVHNCEPVWTGLTHGDPNHWRNHTSAFFYCTHSFGPMRHMTGLRPVCVTGFELPHNSRAMRMGKKAGGGAIEMVTMENGMVCKSLHGNIGHDSVWYLVAGSKGVMETARNASDKGGNGYLYCGLDVEEGVVSSGYQGYHPEDELSRKGAASGHGGSDYVCIYNALQHIAGEEGCDVIDVYEALEMWMVGHMAYLSVLDGGKSQPIPDLRKPEVREAYRGDYRCCDPKVAGDQLLPCYSKGDPDIPESVYEGHRKKWAEKEAKRAAEEAAKIKAENEKTGRE